LLIICQQGRPSFRENSLQTVRRFIDIKRCKQQKEDFPFLAFGVFQLELIVYEEVFFME